VLRRSEKFRERSIGNDRAMNRARLGFRASLGKKGGFGEMQIPCSPQRGRGSPHFRGQLW
jgi:hypothetical protein